MSQEKPEHRVTCCSGCYDSPADLRGPDHCESCREANELIWGAVGQRLMGETGKKRKRKR